MPYKVSNIPSANVGNGNQWANLLANWLMSSGQPSAPSSPDLAGVEVPWMSDDPFANMVQPGNNLASSNPQYPGGYRAGELLAAGGGQKQGSSY